ncbi:MAG: hypothetical protein DCC88_02345 [Spirobacillus cienkowskii]|uniref:Beta-lactamase-related domain-containing protein n=1 Tax=Spirobacillus cienkowskii TaxID=495820 RepID=A0A369L0L5_9BACT|nr:MAG: hypothetical protein DCC88_02345 [Spirobacillus cienkowskii]
MNFTIQKILSSTLPESFLQCAIELEEKVNNNNFTSWSFANQNGCMSAYWADEYSINNKKNNDNLHPCFDLSSLTKPFFINLFFREKFKDDYIKILLNPLKEINIDLNKSGVNKNLLDHLINHKNRYTLDSFLSHYSGAKKWFWMGSALWDQSNTYYDVLINKKDKNFINKVKINLNNSVIKSFDSISYGNNCYSDVNYFLLARIVEDNFLDNNGWIGLINFLNNNLNTNFYHSSIHLEKINNFIPFYSYMSINKDEISLIKKNKFKYGFCNDNNANFLSYFRENSIVSGHAGFFGNIIDVKIAVKKLINSQRKILNSKNYISKVNNQFVFGLDTPSKENSVSGIKDWDLYKNKVFGHLGYTGTSFWFCVDENKNEQYHILLTNRTAKRKKYGIKKCPRIFIYNEYTSCSKYFLLNENDFYECSEEEVQSALLESRKLSKIIWNYSDIKLAPNINELRINLAKKLWNI